jgi:ribosomal protein L18E
MQMVKVVLEHRTKSHENTKELVKLIKKVRSAARTQPVSLWEKLLWTRMIHATL